jgi:integrase
MANFKSVILKGEIHTKADKTTNIKIRITHNRKVNYISTDLYVLPGNFDTKTGLVKIGPNREHINLTLAKMLFDYQRKCLEFGETLNSLSVAELKELVQSKKTKITTIDFFDYAEILINKTNSIGTAQQYKALSNSLKSFVSGRLPFSAINLNFLLNYEIYLKNRGTKNGIINYMRTFRAIFNKARDFYNDEDRDIIKIANYPFKKYKFPKRKVKSNDHVLTIDELKMFINYKHTNPDELFAKDMFLLMFYLIGIESKDLFHLQKPRSGRVNYTRFKTGRNLSVKLEPEAIEIINRYKGKINLLNVSERFSLNKSFYRCVNNYLQGEKSHHITGIFERLGINKPVTTKWARHTWATIARNECRINKSDVALCLGHEDEGNHVTDIYVKYDYSIIDESNRKVIDYLYAKYEPQNKHETQNDNYNNTAAASVIVAPRFIFTQN